MLPSDDDVGEWNDAAVIEESLRRLPTPATPPGLEGRLIAAIPQQRAVEQASIPGIKDGGSSRRWVVWATAAAAILVLTAIVVRQANHDVAEGLRGRDGDGDERRDAGRSVFVVTKETDPCNILPPIPDWL